MHVASKPIFWTLYLCLFGLIAFGASGKKQVPTTPSPYYLIVSKSENLITLYDANDWVVQWPCTFGSDDLGDKFVQGDKRTPEGTFTILSKKPHAKWHKFMLLDYPTALDRKKFADRKKAGIIPANAKIGGSIGIHGTWPHEEFAIDNLQNWTQGCISMRNDHLDELYDMITVGTKVYVKK